MLPEDTAASYDELAPHWASPEFDSQSGIAQHERAIRFTSKRGGALDIGCGSSGRIIQLLLHRGFEVEGLDLSSKMIALARTKHPGVAFHHADICSFVFTAGYDFISAWDSIWHVPLALHQQVLKKLC